MLPPLAFYLATWVTVTVSYAILDSGMCTSGILHVKSKCTLGS